MWAVAHPLRLQIWHLLVEGPSTASKLARRLARAGAIVEASELGDRRDRWWRRPELYFLAPSDDDLEGRAISVRTMGVCSDSGRRSRIPSATTTLPTAT
jgi:hypothetical protein